MIPVLAHLACDLLDTGVCCAIVIDRDREAVWTRAMGGHITLSSRSDFLSTEPITREIAPELSDSEWRTDRDFARDDFLACGTITIRASLDGADGVIWRATKTIHGACETPRVRVHARCDRAMIAVMPIEYGVPAEPQPVISCALEVDHAPADVALHAYALTAGGPVGGDGLALELPDRPSTRTVRLALTTDGGAIVWRGTARVAR